MPISKIGSKALVDCSVAAVDIADNSITAAKLAGSIANAKLANSSVTINSTSVSLGASANINALDWQSVIVADGSTGTTGVAGRGYFINTTSAAHTFTLPVSATRGDTIAIKDYAGTFATFNLTIARNGHNIQGVANNSLISTNRASVVLVYADVTRGWEFVTESNVAELVPVFITATGGTILTSGDFKTHVFTGDGCFVVSTAGNSIGSNSVEYLVVAGGGGGGGRGGGGAGAGGYRQNYPSPTSAGLPVTATTFPITVGGGGAGGPSTFPKGISGSSSIFSTITSAGGGGGAAGGDGGDAHKGVPGGSGGAPTNTGCGTTHTAGTGNTPPVSPPQGNNSGFGGPTTLASNAAGGGGAGASGTPSDGPNNGFGGVGATIADSFFGPTAPSYGTPGPAPGRYFAGGGAGNAPAVPGGTGGGSGGGGNSSPRSPNTTPGVSGTTNTGGGGGGGAPATPTTGGAGGLGIVVIRYKFQ